jgi:hypothetical protein
MGTSLNTCGPSYDILRGFTLEATPERTARLRSNTAHRPTISPARPLTRDYIDANLTEARELTQTHASQKSYDVLRHPGIPCGNCTFAHEHNAQLTG